MQVLSIALLLSAAAPTQDDVYAKRLTTHGIEVLATEAVDTEYLYIAARVWEHMTSRNEPYDLRAAHRRSGFRILLITEDERFGDLPEFAGADEELEQAGGLGGCIGEFFVALRVGSPHVLVHELGHGIYHSAIQYEETGGATDEAAWYEERVQAVHGMSFEAAVEELGEEQVHEVLLAEDGTFSARLAAAWRSADRLGLWADEYAGTEPNEYWAEGVALWFRAGPAGGEDAREVLRERDPLLHALCASVFPNTGWRPSDARVDGPGSVWFEDAPEGGLEDELLEFFAEVDGDGDGAFALDDVPADERRGLEEEFEQLDVDGDGLVTREELLALLDEEHEAEFEVEGDVAVMRGVIGPSTPRVVHSLLREHPDLETIVMADVPGSMDDHANLRAARMVRERGLATHVPAGGEVASGGTDFFLAGVRRTAAEGARFGVHSWGGPGVDGAEVPRDDPEHAKYLEYYREMGIPEAFYWYTLEAAPADDIHWMTGEELELYEVLTEPRAPTSEGDESDVDDGLLGGAVLRRPLGVVPDDLRAVTDVVATRDIGPFTKKLTACGVTLAAADTADDEFLRLVGRVIGEVFREREGIDPELQAGVLRHLYAYRATLPVPSSERELERLFRREPEAMDRLQREHSICDIILSDVPEGQVMEVVEHVLHAITDVGLHYGFPDEWGLTHESRLHEAMQEAIRLGHYEVESYDDLRRDAPSDVYLRVLLQEFAYWFVSTAWDLQTDYGPVEDEWQLRTPEALRRELPGFWAVYERTAGRVMSAPLRATLVEIGPTRAEERGR